jgi:hypothetical protein
VPSDRRAAQRERKEHRRHPKHHSSHLIWAPPLPPSRVPQPKRTALRCLPAPFIAIPSSRSSSSPCLLPPLAAGTAAGVHHHHHRLRHRHHHRHHLGGHRHRHRHQSPIGMCLEHVRNYRLAMDAPNSTPDRLWTFRACSIEITGVVVRTGFIEELHEWESRNDCASVE